MAALEHGDIRQPVLLCEIVGGGEAMPAATDDQDVIRGLRCSIAPGGLPAAMVSNSFTDQGLDGVAGHRALARAAGSGAGG